MISPANALIHVAPDFIDSLTPRERLVLASMRDLWLRPEQHLTRSDWRYYGYICGRGYGKTHAIASEINRRVEAGEAQSIGLMAPTLLRVDQVQIKTLIETAPPWFKPVQCETGCVWPNGARAIAFSPEAPGRPRSENFDLVWLTEIVDWQATTRVEAFNNMTTACRVRRAQVIWDTTNKGQNEVILSLLDLHDSDPATYPVQRGAMFDNPLLGQKYLRGECQKYTPGTRAYNEEVLGLVYGEAAGALWAREWIELSRRHVEPRDPEIRLVSIDPGLTGDKTSDPVGFIVGSRDRLDRHVYIEEDHTSNMSPDMYGDLAVRKCIDRRCTGVIIERNHLGEHAALAISSAARNHNMQVRLLPKGEAFPAFTPGVIYLREVIAASSKTSRAGGPASETKAGRVHVVGTLPGLELEWTTYEPGTRKSPNRFDASVYLILELSGLGDEPQDAAGDVAQAAAAHQILNQRLRELGNNRRI